MNAKPFQKIVLIGAGLIGGSFALALKKADKTTEVVGFGRSEATLLEARARGILDRIATDFSAELPSADVVLIATPVGQMPAIFRAIAPHLGKTTWVTDGGSTKSNVVAMARAHLGHKIAQFVPAHPIAGAENSGASAAKADLYQGKKVVITPLSENTKEAIARITAIWEACGAKVSSLQPEEHDQIFAAVSHLPHLLSFALVHELAKRENADLFFDFAASGFRDFTRIAASSPEMWRDIALANQNALIKELRIYQTRLSELTHALQNQDGEALEAIFTIAKIARRAWTQTSESV